MSWQKCPVCNGSGQVTRLLDTTTKCNTCKSSGIINELTGLPPYEETNVSSNSGIIHCSMCDDFNEIANNCVNCKFKEIQK